MTSSTLSVPTRIGTSGSAPALDIVVPVHNEERDLEPSVRRLHEFLRTAVPFSARVTVVDNASTDETWNIAQRLAGELPDVRAVHLTQKGRGRALRTAWSSSDAAVLAYMDVDLSTDLKALLPLVAPLLSGHSDVAIGTRLSHRARVERGPKREVLSRGYNALLRTFLGARFSDAQCGFKAVRADRARLLLPLVVDDAWFFDTELLVLAERAGLRIHEVPVDWVDDPDSRVDIVATAVADLRGVARLAGGLVSGRIPLAPVRDALAGRHGTVPPKLFAQTVRFASVGVVSTVAYLLVYLGLRQTVTAQVANVLALLVTAIANTWANRRWTFGIRGSDKAMRHQMQGLAVLAAVLLLTSSSLAALHALAPKASHVAEVVVLVIANLAATVLRFGAMRAWVFRTGAIS